MLCWPGLARVVVVTMMPRLLGQRPRGPGLISQTAAAEKGCSLKTSLGLADTPLLDRDRSNRRLCTVFRDGRSWRFRRLQPKTAFSRLPPVRKADLIGQLRVDLTRSAGSLPGRPLPTEPLSYLRLRPSFHFDRHNAQGGNGRTPITGPKTRSGGLAPLALYCCDTTAGSLNEGAAVGAAGRGDRLCGLKSSRKAIIRARPGTGACGRNRFGPFEFDFRSNTTNAIWRCSTSLWTARCAAAILSACGSTT